MTEEKRSSPPFSIAYNRSAKGNRERWEKLKDQHAEDVAEDRAEAHEGETLAEQSYDPETNTIDPFGYLEEDEGPPET